MSTSFSGSLPLLSTLFVFYYTDFMANKICMYICTPQHIYSSLPQCNAVIKITMICPFIVVADPPSGPAMRWLPTSPSVFRPLSVRLVVSRSLGQVL